RLRQSGTPSAGLWLFQTAPNKDQAFVGMQNDTHVGFWGNTGVGWGLVMDTGTGNVGVGTVTPGAKLEVPSSTTGQVGISTVAPGFGLCARNSANNSPWAALASATLAGFFSGNVQVSGTLSKSAGTFKIDHPLDPANKYLNHSLVESPEMLNVYAG